MYHFYKNKNRLNKSQREKDHPKPTLPHPTQRILTRINMTVVIRK